MLQKVNKEQRIDCSPWEGIHVLTAHPASCKLCLGFQFKPWPKQELLHLSNYSVVVMKQTFRALEIWGYLLLTKLLASFYNLFILNLGAWNR